MAAEAPAEPRKITGVEGGDKDRKGLTMDMEHERQHPHSHLFTLRLWEETLGEGKAEWRGRVQEIASGETAFFRDWPGLVATLTRLIAKSAPRPRACRPSRSARTKTMHWKIKKAHCDGMPVWYNMLAYRRLPIRDSCAPPSASKVATMTRLDIRLLGEFAVFNDGAPLTTINSQRLQCLLAYLLLHRDAPVARQRLAFLFWPDSTEAQARSNLRNLLHALGQALPNGEHFVEADGQTVQWLPGAPYTLDVDSLLTSLDQAQTAQDLQQALDLYRGPLLPSCYDDWIVPERERLEQKVADVLQRFIDRWEKEGSYRDAITFAQYLVRRDPLREDLYRQIMRLYALSGDRAGIARTYKECREVLQRELDVEPSRQTVEAYEQCLRMETPGVRAPLTTLDRAACGTAGSAHRTGPAAVRHTGCLKRSNVSRQDAQIPEKPWSPDRIRRAILSDALQAPSTEIPLALAAMARIYCPAVCSPHGLGRSVCAGPAGAGGHRRGRVFHLAFCHPL